MSSNIFYNKSTQSDSTIQDLTQSFKLLCKTNYLFGWYSKLCLQESYEYAFFECHNIQLYSVEMLAI